MSRLLRTAAAFFAAYVLALPAVPARAQTADANAVRQGIVEPANLAIKQYLDERRRASQAQTRPQQSSDDTLVQQQRDPDSIAQLRPGGEPEAPISHPGFP